MFGWNGKFLRVNLSKNKAVAEEYEANIAKNFLGGRGFAAKILLDELKPGIDPLSPENKLVFATDPLTGFALPISGKLVVAEVLQEKGLGRTWNTKKTTLKRLGLEDVAKQLKKRVKLFD